MEKKINFKSRFIGCIVLALILVCGMCTYTQSSYADDTTYDSSWTGMIDIHSGGSENITLDGVTITGTTSPGISITNNSNVTINLKGTNSITGAAGYAGIYVEPGSTLTIKSDDGTGVLTAKGGNGGNSASDDGGGAGIGGNSISDMSLGYQYQNFGTINIQSGTVNATGGASGVNSGAGAGIGTGGVDGGNYFDMSGDVTKQTQMEGTINISGGTVTAVGGTDTTYNACYGGAGIGTGAIAGNVFYGDNSKVNINISGGTINATGGYDGAGIGGGSNAGSGLINITGGNITAKGTDDLDASTYGGAGIGGGDNGWVHSIYISSGTVNATGGGAGAGVGGGHFGAVNQDQTGDPGEIVISGDANLVANGGEKGGAGIGSGSSSSYYMNCDSGNIYIKDNAVVTAFGGEKAQAIGVGKNYKEDDSLTNTLYIDNTATCWMLNSDTTRNAFSGQKDDGSATTDDLTAGDDITVLWYTVPEGTALPASGDMTANKPVTTNPKWTLTGNTLTITDDDGTLATINIPSGFTLGNFGVTVYAEKEYQISYDLDGGINSTANPSTYKQSQLPITLAEPTKPGYTFLGWTWAGQTDPQKSVTITAGTSGNLKYTACWEANTTPGKKDPASGGSSGTGTKGKVTKIENSALSDTSDMSMPLVGIGLLLMSAGGLVALKVRKARETK